MYLLSLLIKAHFPPLLLALSDNAAVEGQAVISAATYTIHRAADYGLITESLLLVIVGETEKNAA